MDSIKVNLNSRSYEILIKRGMLVDPAWGGAAARVIGLASGGRIVFVSDENVWAACGAAFFETLKVMLADNGLPEPFAVLIKPGEQSKTLGELGRVMNSFAEAELGRGGLVVCMGGGVVGDLGGFGAAVWNRGVHYVQIPTTLLAMVDSSVGGKTGLDIPAGKNLVGAFHQPALVLVDASTLRTLPEREFRSGMAEVIKYGVIESEEIFTRLERMNPTAGLYDEEFQSVIADCIRIKAEIVAEDELDNGRRQILNFGHTFGHAIEAKYGYEKYTHGEAVAIGMRFAARYGEMAGVTAGGVAARIDEVLERWGLCGSEQTDGLVELIRNDKKAKGETIDLVLPLKIGKTQVVRTLLSELEAGLRALAV